MISAKQNICRGLLFAACYILTGCGGWIPSHKATMNEVYPPSTYLQSAAEAPQGSVRERIFQAHYNEVYYAVEKSLPESEFKIHSTSKPSGIILATQERILEPPPDLLNCPNNHFANSKPQKWTYYIAIVIAEKEPSVTLLRMVAKTQGRCFEGGGCLYGYDPCSDYAKVHWALGYESAEKQLSQFISIVENNLGKSGIGFRLSRTPLSEKDEHSAATVESSTTVAIPKQSELQPTAKETARDGRFIAYDNGTVIDTRTNLMWAAKDNGSSINWENAKSYCENYRGGGYTDWRMPKQDELAGLFDKIRSYISECGNAVHLTDFIRLTCSAPWASEARGSSAAFFNFSNGKRPWNHQSGNIVFRALPVRSGK